MNNPKSQFDIDSEKSVLGAILLNPKVYSKVSIILNESSFYDEKHSYIFKAMMNLKNSDSEIDVSLLISELERTETLDNSGGMIYISDLASSVPTSANVEHYARIVEDFDRRRRLSTAITGILNGLGTATLTDTLISQLSLSCASLGVSGRKDLEHISTLTDSAKNSLQEMKNRGNSGGGVVTGILALDKIIYGLDGGEVFVLAARPSVGKSAIAANIAVNVARAGKCVLFYSLEMSNNAVIERMMGIDSKFSSWEYKSRYDNGLDVSLAEASDKLKELDIYIHDGANLSWDEVKASIWSHLDNHKKPDIIIIDYLQLMSIKGFREGRQQEISTISRGVKGIAREVDVPIVALAQLSRAGGTEDPQLHHLKESGAIEQDADYVLLVSRVEKQGVNTKLKLDLAKNRTGPTGVCEVLFQQQTQRIVTFSHDEEPQAPVGRHSGFSSIPSDDWDEDDSMF